MTETTPSLPGFGFPSGSSRRIPARLMLVADGLELVAEDGTLLASAPRDGLQVDPRLGSAARRITFPDGTMFETEDHTGAEAVFGRDRWSVLHGFEQFHIRLIPITIAAVVAMYLVYRYALSALVNVAVALTPQPLVDQIDRGTLQTLDFVMVGESALPEDRRTEIEAIFDDMVATLPPRIAAKHEFELLFRDGGRIGPNALALPGGTIIITDEFTEEFPETDILAAVIGHEIGHVVEEHGLQQLYRALGLYFLVTMLAGETGPMMEDVLLEGNALMSLGYSRVHEREADQFGLLLTHDAGYNPYAMQVFFERVMEMENPSPEFLSTHPSSESRADAVARFIADEIER